MGKKTDFKNLNDAQLAAVQAGLGPYLVVAGAGTGKTSVIVERICRLLDGKVSPGQILALTFTEKAAAEMLDRVNLALGTYQIELPILTFNAFGESLLRRYGIEIGLGRNFTTLGESAQIVFLRERLDELGLDYFAPLSSPDSHLKDLAEYFSRLKQNVITPEDYATHITTMHSSTPAEKLELKKHQELVRAYDSYIKLCREANVVDYDDQIYLCIELFRLRPNVLKTVQDNYKYVMVDEFQDTNTMQSELIDLIVAKSDAGAGNLFVVGDDDQSIYGWRGATLANILDFKKRYPIAKDITLVQNYRSTQPILDAAYRLIQNNNPHRLEERLKINKRLVTDKKGAAPKVLAFETLDEELTWIAEDIKKRLDDGASPADIAVMARRNTTTELLHRHLEFAGIDHAVAGERYDLYRHPAVRMLLEALKSVADPLDNTALYHTLTSQLFSVPAGLMSVLSSASRRSHVPLQQAINDDVDKATVPAKKALQFIEEWRNKISSATVGQLAYQILEDTGYMEFLRANAGKDPLASTAGLRLSELFKTMGEFEQIAIVPSVVQYVESLPALQAATDESTDSTLDLSGQRVNVLTVHKSKGLEWPIVYIADCTEGSFPLRQNSSGLQLPQELLHDKESVADEHIAEERRLMYVAMTRARDELVLTHANSARTGSPRRPSRFLNEAFGKEEFEVHKPYGQVMTHIIGFHGEPTQRDVEIPVAMVNGDHVHLTVSQVEKYLRCPLDFYYRYVLCVPEEPSPSMQYGTLMHNLMEDMNRSFQDGKIISLSELENRLNKAWPKAGYFSPKHRDRAYENAKSTLKKLHARVAKENRIPVAIEEPFAITLQDSHLSVSGRFDAVLPLGDGVEIVDYKTSANIDTPEKAKSRASNSQQLTLYALAWKLMHDELPALVTLDFIETGERGSLKKTQRGLDGALSRLDKVASGIRARDFSPGRDHKYCSHPPV